MPPRTSPLVPSTPIALTAVGVAGAAAAIWGIAIERYLFTVRWHELPILPAGSRPLRVLHLSDAHMAPWQHRKQRWIAALADLEPDLVINTGDNMGHIDGLRGLRSAFDPLRGIPGFFVHGSNDHVAPSPRNPLKYLTGPSKASGRPRSEPLDTEALDGYLSEELGWIDLDNAVGSVEAAGLLIAAFGVSDAHREWDRLEVLPPLLEKLRETSMPDLTLGVMHAPYRRILDGFLALGADMIFGGHTHGGQVRIPLSPAALVANCDIPLRQARGVSAWSHAGRSVPLNVSAGLGTSIYAPVRFACRPEASLLTLTARS